MKISKEDRDLIEQTVKEAELKTSGEIVPVILSESDLYPAAHFRLSLMMGISFSLIFYYLADFDDAALLLWIQIPGILLGYLIAFFNPIKRLLIKKSEMAEEVYQRALQAFYENQVSMTRDRTGIMILISLLEKKVVVLADCGINLKVEKEYWEKLKNNLVDDLKNEKMIMGMVKAIKTCGQELEEHFPIKDDDSNEISNRLITDK